MALVRGLASTGWGVLRKSPQYTEPQLMYVLNRIIIPSHLISLMSQGCFELYIRWYENTICACVCICVWSYCCEYYHLFSNEMWFFFYKACMPWRMSGHDPKSDIGSSPGGLGPSRFMWILWDKARHTFSKESPIGDGPKGSGLRKCIFMLWVRTSKGTINSRRI